MSPTSQFDKYKETAFAKYGIEKPSSSDANETKSENPPSHVQDENASDKVSAQKNRISDLVGLPRLDRGIPPKNGVWKMPLLSGQYYMLTFVNGIKHGLVTMWSEKDVCLMEGYYDNNALSGLFRTFDSLGRITMAFHYTQGKLNGYLVSYQPNGLLAYESWYVDGAQEGLMRSYNQFGELAQECMYHNGYRHGKCVTYFPKNQGPCQISYFEKGLQVGEEQLFYPNGVVMQSTSYKDGLPVSYPSPVDIEGKPIANSLTQAKPPLPSNPLGMSAPWDNSGIKPLIDTKPRLSHSVNTLEGEG